MPVIKVRGTADTDLLKFGEVREIATSPYVQNLMRLGLIEQVIERPTLADHLQRAREFAAKINGTPWRPGPITVTSPVLVSASPEQQEQIKRVEVEPKKRRRRTAAEPEDAAAQAQVDAENAQVALADGEE